MSEVEIEEDCLIPTAHMLPEIIRRTISLVIALSTELRESINMIKTTAIILKNTQHALIIQEDKYEKSCEHMELLKKRSDNKEEAFIQIEYDLRNDFNQNKSSVNKLNNMVATLKSKVRLNLSELKPKSFLNIFQHLSVSHKCRQRSKEFGSISPIFYFLFFYFHCYFYFYFYYYF